MQTIGASQLPAAFRPCHRSYNVLASYCSQRFHCPHRTVSWCHIVATGVTVNLRAYISPCQPSDRLIVCLTQHWCSCLVIHATAVAQTADTCPTGLGMQTTVCWWGSKIYNTASQWTTPSLPTILALQLSATAQSASRTPRTVQDTPMEQVWLL